MTYYYFKVVEDHHIGSVLFRAGEIVSFLKDDGDTAKVIMRRSSPHDIASLPKLKLISHGVPLYSKEIYDNNNLEGKLVVTLGEYNPHSSIQKRIKFREGEIVRVVSFGVGENSNFFWVKKVEDGAEGYAPYNFLNPNPLQENAGGRSSIFVGKIDEDSDNENPLLDSDKNIQQHKDNSTVKADFSCEEKKPSLFSRSNGKITHDSEGKGDKKKKLAKEAKKIIPEKEVEKFE